MRYSRSKRWASQGMSFNFTSMIDLVFTLSMFYMLISKFHSAEQVQMQLPSPEQSQARVTKLPDRVVVNCTMVPTADPRRPVAEYAIGANPPDPLPVLEERLAFLKQQQPNLKVVVRADKRLEYADVRAMLEVFGRLQIDMVNVVALTGKGD